MRLPELGRETQAAGWRLGWKVSVSPARGGEAPCVGGGGIQLERVPASPSGILLQITTRCQGLTGLINGIGHTCACTHTLTHMVLRKGVKILVLKYFFACTLDVQQRHHNSEISQREVPLDLVISLSRCEL